jgi:hypothetical protein
VIGRFASQNVTAFRKSRACSEMRSRNHAHVRPLHVDRAPSAIG